MTSDKGNFASFLVYGAHNGSMVLFLVGGLEEMAVLCQEIALLEQIICSSNVFTEISAILTLACCTLAKNLKDDSKLF